MLIVGHLATAYLFWGRMTGRYAFGAKRAQMLFLWLEVAENALKKFATADFAGPISFDFIGLLIKNILE